MVRPYAQGEAQGEGQERCQAWLDLGVVDAYRAAAQYGHRMTVYGVPLKPWMLPLKAAIQRAGRNQQMRGYYRRVRKKRQ